MKAEGLPTDQRAKRRPESSAYSCPLLLSYPRSVKRTKSDGRSLDHLATRPELASKVNVSLNRYRFNRFEAGLLLTSLRILRPISLCSLRWTASLARHVFNCRERLCTLPICIAKGVLEAVKKLLAQHPRLIVGLSTLCVDT